jgi:hypothetical protein
MAAIAEKVRGSRVLLKSVAKEPALVKDLPRWVADAGDRFNPLGARRPWWNYAAVRAVGESLRPRDRVFEYGGGASSLWFVDQGADLTTVESDRAWFDDIREAVGAGAELRLAESDGDGYATYVHSIDQDLDESFDVIVVDGRERVRCGLAAIPKLKPGGRMILDDSDRARYSPLFDELAGWRPVSYRGLKPGIWSAVQTTVWTKPRRTDL